MKKLILAACVAAIGLPTYAQRQAPSAPPQPAFNSSARAGGGAVQEPARPNVDYGYYGGPTNVPMQSSTLPTHKPDRLYGLYGPYKLYGVPDDLTIAEQERDRIREAAVEFGRFRRQFTGSTQFWMDEHRTELAKSRYAMDEPMWRALHPPEYFGDGGYLYHTAESVGSEVIWGPPQPILIENPQPVVDVTPYTTEPVPASRRTTTVAPRVIAGDKPIYDAAATVSSGSK